MDLSIPGEITYYLDRSPKFDFSDPNNPHDKILLVENVKFYAHSVVLSVLSPVLKGIFNEFSDATEITIPNVKADDFRGFLEVVYGTGKAVTARDCAAVLDMAIHFAVPPIIDDCIDFIDSIWQHDDIPMKHLLDIYEVVHKHNLVYQMQFFGEEFFSYEVDGFRSSRNYGEELRAEWSRVGQMSMEGQNYIFQWIIKPRSAFSDLPSQERRDGLPTLAVLDFMDPSIHHDRTLLVGGKEFYVVSKFLATWSGFFRAMFYGSFKESNQNRVEIEGISADDFNAFLHAIHQNGRNITDENCASIMDTAWYFDCQGLIQLCCQFTVDLGNTSLMGKLRVMEVAMKHNMQEMKMFFASECVPMDGVHIDDYLDRNGEMSDDLRMLLQEIKQGTYQDSYFDGYYYSRFD